MEATLNTMHHYNQICVYILKHFFLIKQTLLLYLLILKA